MPKYDARCRDCGEDYEETRKWDEAVLPCPVCGSKDTHTVWKRLVLIDKAKDPYDYLDGPIPSSKPIRSYANDKRKGGKDTT